MATGGMHKLNLRTTSIVKCASSILIWRTSHTATILTSCKLLMAETFPLLDGSVLDFIIILQDEMPMNRSH